MLIRGKHEQQPQETAKLGSQRMTVKSFEA